jgi:hypothetical protein
MIATLLYVFYSQQFLDEDVEKDVETPGNNN